MYVCMYVYLFIYLFICLYVYESTCIYICYLQYMKYDKKIIRT